MGRAILLSAHFIIPGHSAHSVFNVPDFLTFSTTDALLAMVGLGEKKYTVLFEKNETI